jgi:transcriptional regulator GlxA family with amidase domain
MATPPKILKIGVFLPTEVQLLDLSPIDLFAMLSPTYLTTCKLPAPLIALGIPSVIHYISLGTPEISLTASLTMKTPKTIKDQDVQPGMLDILLVPGPQPDAVFEEEALRFVRGHAGNEGCDVLSVCTGCRVLACAGVLNGRKASAPRGLVGRFREEHGGVEWDDKRRWVRDGRIWSSGEFSGM